MAIVAFKDLCIDASDPVLLGKFWAAGLGLEFHRQSGGDTYLTGPTEQHTIWVNRVDEPKTVKHRLHLDVNSRSIPEYVDRGATIIDDRTNAWTVMRDPEGGEFCVFVRDEEQRHAIHALVVDCESTATASSLAEWWAAALDATVVHDERGFSSVVGVEGGPFDSLDFVPVPEAKTVKNRLHIDVTARELAPVIAHGAQVLRPQDDEISWTVCADPEGNEFCVFTKS